MYISCITNLLHFKQKKTPDCQVSDGDSYYVYAVSVCQARWRHTRRQTLGKCSTAHLNKRSQPDFATGLQKCMNISNCGIIAETTQGNSDVIDWCIRTVADGTADSTDEYRLWIFINNHITPRLSWKKYRDSSKLRSIYRQLFTRLVKVTSDLIALLRLHVFFSDLLHLYSNKLLYICRTHARILFRFATFV